MSALPSLSNLTLVGRNHPVTGELIRPLWIRPDGRACWPMIGADDGPPAADPPPANTPPADPANPPADPPANPGFPANTPVAEMKPAEQAAYWQAQSRKHEGRAAAWQAASGVKTPDELKPVLGELDTLRQSQLTDQEKAVEAAKLAGRTEASATFAKTLLDTLLPAVDDDAAKAARELLLDTIDLSKVITDSGEVDTAKVRALAETLAPAKGPASPPPPNFGGGPRPNPPAASGVKAGAAMYAAGKKPTS